MEKDPKQETDSPSGFTVVKRQTSNLRQRWEWTESSIWTNNMLAALENGVKGGKWFSLIDKAYQPEVLMNSWKKVRKNKGAAGIDNQSIERFQSNAPRYLNEIHEELKLGTYRPNAVKRVHIDKGQGKTRPLGIPTVKDRIAQMAVKMAIEPIMEKDFLPMSYGFRPQKRL